MGKLAHFNIEKLIKSFDLSVFIETGTAYGDGLAFAAQFDFNKLCSIEYDQGLYNICSEKFKDNNKINLLWGDSKTGLEAILEQGVEGNILFWLDSHFHLASTVGNEETFNAGEESLRYPLQDELDLIKRFRSNSKDVIIIDDLRIYENGPYECGNLPTFINKPKNKLNYNIERYNETRDYNNEGYLILTPKL